uniref:Chromatin assembly factor 1 subunit B-like isoform X1 n=1 Tax=Crassostrea virginica TaxID=6565 RepID=A0A8B8AMY7_CRAVI|nr:chromatin assembly factor 1 subunit B-like isoform X1 [Crassostrea virginica]
MKVTTPEISWHERDPVYSADFQPGTHAIQRIATAGVDKYTRIWKVNIETDGKCAVEFLSNLKRHSKSVNVCRFSPDGDHLATAGDDEVVIIWKLSDSSVNPGNLFQDEDEDNKENWVTCKIFRGHLAEVYDLCWSADGKKIVSGSMDNTAIVWDVVKEQRLALFNEHKSFVQGVAMDPLNEYVATMSTDRSCRIFNISSKNCVFNVSKMSLPVPKNSEGTPETKPKSFRMFHDDTMRSFFRRLCFSPDGEILIVPAGCMELGENKVINATYLMSRHSLNKPAAYLPSPHKITVCVRCCPCYFKLKKNTESSPDHSNNNKKEWEKCKSLFALPYRMVFAVGTEDAVLLYDTQQQSPFAYISNIHYHQLSDLAWSPDGHTLLISSTDGYCTFIRFGDDELGELYTDVKVQDSSEVKAEKSTSEKSSPTASSVSSKSEEPVVMDMDTSSGELNLILETTNDATSPVPTAQDQKDSKTSAIMDTNNAEGEKTPSGIQTTPLGPGKQEVRQSSTSTPTGSKPAPEAGSKGTPTGSKSVPEAGSKGTPTGSKSVPEAGSKGTPSGQPRRIQFITLSNGKAS